METLLRGFLGRDYLEVVQPSILLGTSLDLPKVTTQAVSSGKHTGELNSQPLAPQTRNNPKQPIQWPKHWNEFIHFWGGTVLGLQPS